MKTFEDYREALEDAGPKLKELILEGGESFMRKKDCFMDALIAAALLAVVLAMMLLAGQIMRSKAADEQVLEIMKQAQEQIDACHAARPARERPAVTVVPVVTVDNPPEPVEDWYIADLPLDRELQKALWDACQEFGIDYALALAIIEQETNYSNILGDGGASVGFFQIQPRWWGKLMERIGTDDLTDPVDNFRTGCAVLRELLLRYDGSVTDALTAYNSGHPGQSTYASAVMERAEGYRW